MDPSTIFTAYQNVGQQYATLIHQYAIDLLGSLILLEIVTIALTYMMGDSDNPPAVLWSCVRLVFNGGFAYWWETHVWQMGLTIFNSFDQIGQKLSGLPNLTPMHILSTALGLAKLIASAPSSGRMLPDFGVALEEILLWFAILIIFALITALVVVTLCAFYLVVGPGSILVSFMPCRFTSAMAESYFTWLVRTGVIVMMFYVVLGTAANFAAQYKTTILTACTPGLSYGPLTGLGLAPLSIKTTACINPIPVGELTQLLVDMVILGCICCGIPFLAGSLVSHGVNMTLEHMAAAKYLAGGTVRALTTVIGGLSHQVHNLAQHLSQRATLNSRIEAGAAAARSAPTTPLAPPPSSGGGWNGKPSGPPIAPPPAGPNNSGPGGSPAGLTYYPGRPGAQTKAEAIDITKLQNH